ncbi:signal peptidase I [bacterium CG10_46_32]|nr:MAG: signal peptidase I [bacterium CG10_46_32]
MPIVASKMAHIAGYMWYNLQTRTGLLIAALVLVLALALGSALSINHRSALSLTAAATSHASQESTNIRVFTITGNSMDPLLKNGQTITVQMDAYASAPVNRGDIVVMDGPAVYGRIVKAVKAIPGDTFAFAKQPDGASQLIVNSAVVKNSIGEPYRLSPARTGVIGLYIQEYHGVIPDNAYLVLGDKIGGTEDSTVFGLIDAGRIKGKILTE